MLIVCLLLSEWFFHVDSSNDVSSSFLLPSKTLRRTLVTFCLNSFSNSSLILRSEAPLPPEELPRFLLLVVDAMLLVRACSPVVTTPPQVLTLLVHELSPHQNLIFAGCLDVETNCLVKRDCGFLGSHGCSRLSFTESVEEVLACREQAVARGERTSQDQREQAARGRWRDAVGFGWLVTQTRRVVARHRDHLLTLTRKFCRQRRCSFHLRGHSAPSPCPSPPSGRCVPRPFVLETVPGLKHRRSRPAHAGVEKDDVASLDVTKTDHLVDKPFVDLLLQPDS